MENNSIAQIPIHYKLEGKNYLDIDDFIFLSTQIKEVALEISEATYGEKLEIKIVMLPSEEGSLLKKMGIIAIGTMMATGVANLAVFTDTEYGQGFVEGLTEKTPAEYGKNHGVFVRDLVVGFMKKTEQEDKTYNNQFNLPKAQNAKNKFYERCIENKDINGIEFSEDFTSAMIPSNRFLEFVRKEERDPTIIHKIHQLIIISSVNIKNETKQWKARDKETNKHISFFMRDRSFYLRFLAGKYPLKESQSDDILTVLMEYRVEYVEGEEKVVERSVIRVYKYNDEVIEEIPENLADSIQKTKEDVPEQQGSLFDQINNDEF